MGCQNSKILRTSQSLDTKKKLVTKNLFKRMTSGTEKIKIMGILNKKFKGKKRSLFDERIY